MNQFKKINYHGCSVTLDAAVLAPKMFKKLEQGRWEPKTFKTLKRFLDPSTTYVDIGSWVGVLPYWALNIAKSVIAVDPDPVCIETLERLKSENSGPITIVHAALSDQSVVSINPIKGFGSSETSVIASGGGSAIEVPGVNIQSLMRLVGDSPAFVKVDIEGYEYYIKNELGSMSRYNIKAAQVAIYPQIYEKSIALSGCGRRWKVFKDTLDFKNLMPGFSVYGGNLGKLKFILYLIFGVLLSLRPRGIDLVYIKK